MQIIEHQPTFGERLGAGLGTGLSSSIEGIINMKLKNVMMTQQKNTIEQALTPFLGREKAAFYSILGVHNPNLLQQILKGETGDNPLNIAQGLQQQGAQQQAMPNQAMPNQAVPGQAMPGQAMPGQAMPGQGMQAPQQQKQPVKQYKTKLSDLRQYRSQMMKLKKATPEKRTKALSQIINRGITNEDLEVILSDKLTEKIARYFFQRSGNDAAKAKKLAKSFGYKG